MKYSTSIIITLLIIFFTEITSLTNAAAIDPCSLLSDHGSDLSVIPMYSKCSPFNKPEPQSLIKTVMDMASKDSARVDYLSTMLLRAEKKTSVPVASATQVLNTGNYIVRVQLGTPGQTMFMVLDTSNDAAFVPCSGCTGCTGTTTFLTNSSTTYGSLDCSVTQCTQVRGSSCPATGSGYCMFNKTYGGASSFSAALVQDSLTLSKDVIPNFSFGCISSASGGAIPPQGLLGMGRGTMSLVSQSGSLYSGVFSYCLPSYRSYYFSGSLKLGPASQPKNIKTTPLLSNPRRPSLYYVNFTGASVGRVKIPIALELIAFDPNTGAGTIIDSGTVITRFAEPVYTAIRDEFRRQVNVNGSFSSLGVFDTCFASTYEAEAPAVTFHFTGLDLKLPTENSLIHSSAGSLACLSMGAMPSNGNSVLNIIANLQQQNLRVMFDVPNSKVGIARELCN